MTINLSTGVGTEIGPTGTDGFQGAGSQPSGQITDISFRPSDQTLFAWAYPGEWVATIDVATGAATQLAFSPNFFERGITANSGNALAFLGSGTLVHAATRFSLPGFPGALHEIDFATTPANQMATVLASLSFPISPVFPAERFARANGMDFDFASETLFASIAYSFGPTRHNFLGTIDTTTGDVTLIGQTKTGIDALAVISSVDIDIKPGSDPNSINPGSHGVIPVAILTTSTADGDALDFDATQVDATTLAFGPDRAGIALQQGHVVDIDEDGDADLVVQFETKETGIKCGDTETTLIGATFGAEPIIGIDTVKTVGCPAPVVGEYINDFSSSVGPASLFGDAILDSGSVRLTDSINGRLGSLVIDDLVPGGAVASFAATFDLQTGPGSVPPADGISFNLGPLPNSAFGEEGTFSGLTIAFDTFDNPGPDAVGIDVRVNGAIVATNPTNPFTNGAFVSVSVVFDSDGTLDLTFDGAPIFINLPTGFTPATGDRFGFGGRTGGFNEENRIDNVNIVVVPQ
jgi:hypothetical protein